ncbi:MAG TPA: DUF3307 domain-containing protein [Anaerolineae bacterium]|nr:DUF3307 domain-containing protein [Anaerolineae bacterium]
MVLALYLSHLVADYWLQWDGLARWKSRAYLGVLAHGLIVLLVTWLFSLPFDASWWPWVLFIWLTHTIVDAMRLRLGSYFPALPLFLLDQTVHLSLITFALAASGYLSAPERLADLLPLLRDDRVLTFALGLAFVTMPAWVLVEFATYGLLHGSAPDFAHAPNKYVSSLERGLMTVLVVLGQFTLVPLVALPRLAVEWRQVSNGPRGTIYVAELLASIALAVVVGLGLRQI